MSHSHPTGTPDQKCAHSDCDKTFKRHRWGKTKAQDWFHGRNGLSFCPDHLPEWVEEWRARKNKLPGGKAVWKGGSE